MVRLAVTLVAAVVPFVLLAEGPLGLSLDVATMGLGALGWTAALLLRISLAVLLSRTRWGLTGRYMELLSGLTEEPVRLGVLLWTGRTVDQGYSLALGWGAIEVLYHHIEAAALSRAVVHADPGDRSIRPLEEWGVTQLLSERYRWWRVMERVTATALHLAFTLFVVWDPLLVLVAMPAHSGLNSAFLALCRRSVAMGQLAIGGVAAVLLVVALALSVV